MPRLTIGTVADAAGVGVETMRFYERKGLVPRPPRDPSNGYRRYPPEAVQRVRFIRHAQELGFSLREIRDLLALRATNQARCADVRSRAEEKIADVEAKIRSLRSMKRALRSLVAECEGELPATSCPILRSLDERPA